ncbi:MAG: ribonuclease HII [Lentisphaerota bacterium]
MDFFDYRHPMLSYERELWDDGFSFIAGVDEAGRGPLAGPLVVSAVIFEKDNQIPVVNDSKKLTAKQREMLYDQILSTAKKYSIIELSEDEVDLLNILQATHKGMRLAVNELEIAQFALIDGLPVPNMPIKSKAIVKGDAKSASIAAASILAKVYRDRLMDKYAELYPQYGFENNKGYGTAKHLEAIKNYGPSLIHRKSFEPVKSLLNRESKIQMELILQ